MSDLFNSRFTVLNVGLQKFAADLASADFSVIHKNWKPVLGR
jgi:hypothetical protein